MSRRTPLLDGSSRAGRHWKAHLDGWTRDLADQRVHGTTGEAPIERVRRAAAGALRSITEVPPFEIARELMRKVQADCVIEVDSNAYLVP
jgi:hypothetical protein